MQIRRGDIFWIDPANINVNHIMKKCRPVLVVTNDAANSFSPFVYVVPFTTRPKKPMPTHVGCFMNNKWQTILCEQILPVSRESFDTAQFVRHIDTATMRKVENALKIELGLNERR